MYERKRHNESACKQIDLRVLGCVFLLNLSVACVDVLGFGYDLKLHVFAIPVHLSC